MRDLTLLLTSRIPRTKTSPAQCAASPFLQSSAQLYFSIREKTLALRKALAEFQKAYYRGDSVGIEQDTRVFLAAKRKEVETLKANIAAKSELEKAHWHQAMGCLYGHLEVMAKLLKSLQSTKRSKMTRLLELEKARNSVLGDSSSFTPRRAVSSVPHAEAGFLRENEQLLLEFQATDSEQVIEIQRSVMDINEMLGSFGVKVAQQQEISERSKTHAVYQQAEESLTHMREASKHLVSANEYSKGVGFYYFLFFLSLSLILLFYDWWTCRTVAIYQ